MSAAVSVVVPYYRAQADLDRLTAALAAYEREGARLIAARRAVNLVEQAMRGTEFRSRL